MVIFLGPKGLLNKAAEKVSGISNVVPGMTQEIHRIEIQQPSKEVLDAFNALVTALNTKSDKPCIVEYTKTLKDGKFPDLENFQFEFVKQDTGWVARLRNPSKLVTHSAEIGNELCVVGGEIYGTDIKLGAKPIARIGSTTDSSGKPIKEVEITYPLIFDGLVSAFGYDKDNINWAAKNFYTNWIAEADWSAHPAYRPIRKSGNKILAPDYTNPRSITITGSKSMDVIYSGGKNSWGKEDGGLLYVAESGKVCFFGTKRDIGIGCDIEDGLLEQDCFDGVKLLEKRDVTSMQKC